MTNITKAAQDALAELADWHWSQAATLRKAAGTSAMDKPEPVQSSLTRLADWHDAQKSIIRAALRPAVEPMTPEQQPNPFSKRCYTMSESHLSGYRLIVGFEHLEDAQDAHTFVANTGRHHGITAKAEGGA